MCYIDYDFTMELGESEKNMDMEKRICNHGFFMMAPNKWISETKTLQRPLRLADGVKSVLVSITHTPKDSFLKITVHEVPYVLDSHRQAIEKQVRRMLRICDRLEAFHEKHEEAKEKDFGMLFRSASLFEDAVKSILLCNCPWRRSLKMAQALCDIQCSLAKKKYGIINNINNRSEKRAKLDREELYWGISNFPSARELAIADENYLKKHCNVGLRAKPIIDLAIAVDSGKLKFDDFDHPFSVITYQEIQNKLIKIKGLGPFTSANILMCLGFYHQIPVDTETIRLVRQVHGRKNCNKHTIEKDAKDIYDVYEPYQCLAYWFDLFKNYESRFGKLSELPPSNYHTITSDRKMQLSDNEYEYEDSN